MCFYRCVCLPYFRRQNVEEVEEAKMAEKGSNIALSVISSLVIITPFMSS